MNVFFAIHFGGYCPICKGKTTLRSEERLYILSRNWECTEGHHSINTMTKLGYFIYRIVGKKTMECILRDEII